jgi:hypothetical protein
MGMDGTLMRIAGVTVAGASLGLLAAALLTGSGGLLLAGLLLTIAAWRMRW